MMAEDEAECGVIVCLRKRIGECGVGNRADKCERKLFRSAANKAGVIKRRNNTLHKLV